MKSIIKSTLALLKIFGELAIILCWTFFILLQLDRGGYTYQVQNSRLKYCYVICLPGEEEYFDFDTGQIESQFTLTRRLRISPWYDANETLTPIDNP